MRRIFLAAAMLSTVWSTSSDATNMSLLGSDLETQTVFADTYISTGAMSNIYGSVFSGDFATVAANSNIYGSLTSGAAATLGASSVVTGDVVSGAAVTIGASSMVGGQAKSVGATNVGASATIGGDVHSGAAVTLGASADVGGLVTAVGATTIGANANAGSVSISGPLAYQPSPGSVATEIQDTQSKLFALGNGTMLSPTISTDITLQSGIYSASDLTTGAGTTLFLDAGNLSNQFFIFNINNGLTTGASSKIVLINGNSSDQVIFNTGGGASLGAFSQFLGALLSNLYISTGANVSVSGGGNKCGGLYSGTSYVSVGANSQIGDRGCSNSGDHVNAVPEPSTWALMLLGAAFIGSAARRRRTSAPA